MMCKILKNNYCKIELLNADKHLKMGSIICFSCLIFYYGKIGDVYSYMFLDEIIFKKNMDFKLYKKMTKLNANKSKLLTYVKKMLMVDLAFNIAVVRRLKSCGYDVDIDILDIYPYVIKSECVYNK